MKNKMSDIELNGLLLVGEDVEYEGFLVRNYSIGDIFKKIKLDKYYYLTGLTVLTPQDMLEGIKPEDIDKLKVYDILLSYPHYNQMFIEFLNTFTYLEWKNGEWNDFVVYDDKHKMIHRINENRFNELMQLVKKMYVVNRGEKVDEYDLSWATSEKAREMMKEFAEDKRKQDAKKSKITLNGIIAGICSTSNRYDFFNIQNLTMYQLMTIYYTSENYNTYQYIMQSAYVGMYDLSKTKIEDIHYCREINNLIN